MSFVCSPKIYEYKGWLFEYGHTGAWPLKKDLEPRKRAGERFWTVIGEFMNLSEADQKRYRVGGGCEQF